jgi:hypothetical protein
VSLMLFIALCIYMWVDSTRRAEVPLATDA